MTETNGHTPVVGDPRFTRASFLTDALNGEKDPAEKIPGMAANFGRDIVPHVMTFQSMVGSHAKVYRDCDEATKNSLDNARYMRNDCGVMECVESRQRCAALAAWHLEPEDAKSHSQKELCAELTKMLFRIRSFTEFRYTLMHGIWYGKYGVNSRYGWQNVSGKMRQLPTPVTEDDYGWKPINGDKLVFRYDDGNLPSGAYANQLGIRVSGNYRPGQVINGRYRVETVDRIAATDRGMAYFLPPYERKLLTVHRHIIEDAAFEDALSAGSIHGVGIRSRIYWEWVQKQETLAFLMEYLERSAGGIEVWTYPQGNETAKTATETAAKERLGGSRNVVIVPKPMGDEGDQYGVQIIEPGMAGIDALKDIVHDFYGHRIKRYILGQTLTSEADATGLGSGVADAHMDTFMQIVRFDALKLEETITWQLLKYMKDRNFPEARGIHVAFKIDVEHEDVKEKLEAYESAYNMGASIKESDVMDLIGAAMPGPEDRVLKQQQPQPMGPGGTAGGGIAPAAGMSPAHFDAAFAKGKTGGDGDQPGDAGGDSPVGGGPVNPGDGGERTAVDQYARDVSGQPRDEQGRWINPESSKPVSGDDEGSDTDSDATKLHEFSSTQFNIVEAGYARSQGSPFPAIMRLIDSIDADDLADDGREESPHITIKFGLHADDPDRLREVVDGFGPVRVTFGKVSLFENEEHDVVKIDIEGDDIHRLNKLIANELPCTDTHPTYKPHATLAYVKPGRGEKYTGSSAVTGMSAYFVTFDFSAKDRTLALIDLLGEVPEPETKPDGDGVEQYARRAKLKPSTHQKQLIGDDQKELRWITLHGHGGEGSVHVQIDDKGNIHAGPAALAEKGIKNLHDFGKKDHPERAEKPSRKVGGEHQPGLFEPDEELGGQKLLKLKEKPTEVAETAKEPPSENVAADSTDSTPSSSPDIPPQESPKPPDDSPNSEQQPNDEPPKSQVHGRAVRGDGKPRSFSRHLGNGKRDRIIQSSMMPKVGEVFEKKDGPYVITKVGRLNLLTRHHLDDMDDFDVESGWHQEFEAVPVERSAGEQKEVDKKKADQDEKEQKQRDIEQAAKSAKEKFEASRPEYELELHPPQGTKIDWTPIENLPGYSEAEYKGHRITKRESHSYDDHRVSYGLPKEIAHEWSMDSFLRSGWDESDADAFLEKYPNGVAGSREYQVLKELTAEQKAKLRQQSLLRQNIAAMHDQISEMHNHAAKLPEGSPERLSQDDTISNATERLHALNNESGDAHFARIPRRSPRETLRTDEIVNAILSKEPDAKNLPTYVMHSDFLLSGDEKQSWNDYVRFGRSEDRERAIKSGVKMVQAKLAERKESEQRDREEEQKKATEKAAKKSEKTAQKPVSTPSAKGGESLLEKKRESGDELRAGGKTFDNKDTLRQMGARWNPRSKEWVFDVSGHTDAQLANLERQMGRLKSRGVSFYSRDRSIIAVINPLVSAFETAFTSKG